ncbi:MAG: tRNA (adenosine(37)-N6)-dimethylallyltransferase MiaA [Chitinophagaceae bacterium]
MEKKNEKRMIIIGGPTASGKTSVAIAAALHFDTEIISADSRQCYKELSIGVARPSAKELQAVKHHFIASHSINETINARDFETFAMEKGSEIFKEKATAVMVGGTGLYIKAFCEGLDDMPTIPVQIHDQVVQDFQNNGIVWAQEEMATLDPIFFSTGEIKNPQRLMRAMEVMRATGKSILDFRKNKAASRPFDVIKIAVDLPKNELHQNINSRVDAMVKEGLVEEVNGLTSSHHLNALNTVGYKEIFSYLKGQLSLEAAMEEIKKHTRQYAKRQITWFKKDKNFIWLQPKEILPYIKTLS